MSSGSSSDSGSSSSSQTSSFDYESEAAGISNYAGSNYNVTKTTTHIDVYQSESNQANVLEFGGSHLDSSTDFQILVNDQGNANDESLCGYLHLYNPSSTTFVKHFLASFDRVG